MQQLFQIYRHLLTKFNTVFVRYLYNDIDWSSRLIVIVGARGVGKTTLAFQRILLTGTQDESLYIDADNAYFSSNSLYDTAEAFYQNGGRTLYIDEIHKYENWSKEVKMIYDYLPELKLVVTGSSILSIRKGIDSDLSRRAISYTLHGMSFREFLNFKYGLDIKPYSLDEILTGLVVLPKEIELPIVEFKEYLEIGYFPFFKYDNYLTRLGNVINQTLEVDIPQYARMNTSTVTKLKKLLYLISCNVPFKPNFKELGAAIGADRALVADYISYMEKAAITMNLTIQGSGMNLLEKTDKIYLGNTNFLFALTSAPDVGTIRETFFLRAMSVRENVYSSNVSDFTIGSHTFEIGGKKKGQKQIKDLADAFVVKDDIVTGNGNILPLWTFGLNY